MNKSIVALIIIGIISLGTIIGISAYTVTRIQTTNAIDLANPKEDSNLGVSWHGIACVSVNGKEIGCSENLITNTGKDYVKGLIGQGGTLGAASFLAVGNTTAPAAGSTSLAGEITTCGLSRATGTYNSYSGQNGNWSISNVFTYSCGYAIMANTTGLYNASSSGTFVAGTTFTNVTLNNNDQLNVTYIVFVT